jgi:hypothetical protein
MWHRLSNIGVRCRSGEKGMAHGGPELLGDPLAQELLQAPIPARFAYTWTDGTPRVVPIWFHWDGTDVVVVSPANAPKTKAIADGSTVALTIDRGELPYRALIIRGRASVSIVDGVADEYVAAASRYMGPEGGAAWVAGLPADMTSLRVATTPEHVTILDFETRFPSALSA